ncbi:TPA: VENN motif pre-toxin domain-containing protein, partial [Yersinia enterocolitica]|nr:VENN motif pre-toxin domain-containing protein [Yersinia enterocolitica]
MTTDPVTGKVNTEANLMAHAVLGAVVAQVNGNSALAGASGAAMGEYIAQQMYPGINREDLTEEQRQTISALGTLAAGLAGGVVGNSTADAVAGAQAGKNAVENNYLSSTEKSRQTYLNNKQNLTPEEQKDKEALNRKDLESDLAAYAACSGKGGDCQVERAKAKDAQDTYFNQTYQNPKEAQAGYQQIMNLLNSTDLNAKEVFNILEGYTQAFMSFGYTEDEAKARAGAYVGSMYIAGGVSAVVASGALTKQFGKDVASGTKLGNSTAKPTVTAELEINGQKFKDTNQTARPVDQANKNEATLIADRVASKEQNLIDKGKAGNLPLPNSNMANAHAEIGVIQQAYNAGKTQDANLTINVVGKDVCSYCKGDIAAAAQASGAKSVTVNAIDNKTGLPKSYIWEPGMKSIKEIKKQ